MSPRTASQISSTHRKREAILPTENGLIGVNKRADFRPESSKTAIPNGSGFDIFRHRKFESGDVSKGSLTEPDRRSRDIVFQMPKVGGNRDKQDVGRMREIASFY